MVFKAVLTFFKNFLIKYLSSVVLEKIVIVSLGELVKRTDSDIDDKLYNVVFKNVKKDIEKETE